MLHKEVDLMFIASMPEHGHLENNHDVFVSDGDETKIILVFVQEIKRRIADAIGKIGL